MTGPQQTTAFTTTYDAGNHYQDTAAAAAGCGCFRRFCFGWDEEESRSYLLPEKEGGGPHKEAWLVSKLKKLRELSELVAGPKWKNLIRKIGKIWHTGKHEKTTVEFGYSPESYALNFAGDDHGEDGELLHSFSMRFAPGLPSMIGKGLQCDC